MADFTVSLTIPDDRVSDAVAALRHHYGRKGDGTEFSVAELRARFKTDVQGQLRSMYRGWKRSEAVTSDLDVT